MTTARHTRTQAVLVERYDTGGDQELPPVKIELVWYQDGRLATYCRLAYDSGLFGLRTGCPGFHGSSYIDVDVAQREFSSHVAEHLEEVAF